MNHSRRSIVKRWHSDTMQSWASAGGGQNGHSPPLEIGSKNHTFLENLKSALLFRLIDLIPAMTVYLTVIHSSLILRVARSFDIFSRTFFQCVSVSGVKRSGDARDDSLIVCPGPLTGGEVGIPAQPAKDCKGNPGSFLFLGGARFCLRQETEVQ